MVKAVSFFGAVRLMKAAKMVKAVRGLFKGG